MPNPQTSPPEESEHPRPRAAAQATLGELAAAAGAELRGADGAGRIRITGFTHDSRQVRPGDLYAAMPGASVHGAEFAAAAAAAGAAAVLTDPAGAALIGPDGPLPVLVAQAVRPALGPAAALVYGAPGERLLMLGVTGTNGKTTTCYLMEGGLREAGRATGLIGTVETRIGERSIKSTRTTPEAPDLQALLGVMVESGVDALAMEVSSHALAYGRTSGIHYAVAAFTNLTQDHLDFHADLEDYFTAKAKLFTPDYAGIAVVNVDDAYGRRIAVQAHGLGVPVWTYSATGEAAANWRAEKVDLGPDGSTFDLVGPDDQRYPAAVRLPGAFNVANAMAAIVTLIAADLEPERAVAGVAAVPGVPGRMQKVEAGQDFLAVVDYAHTPDAISTLLAAVRPVTRGRLAVVIGCGGDRDKAKRPLMGAAAAHGADVVYLTNDNPRSEDPLAILRAAEDGARQAVAEGAGAEIVVIPDRAAAIGAAIGAARTGDTVVVAGKGHERGQEIAGVVHPFDDVEVVRAAVADPARQAGGS
ncbi:MAG TPA: UDP-N-acetylmuramoyl-L-alanyl-D-glutamate--2,6-diaminopimelate ligase [Actinocrinis sp.]|nr:UDP-N-acetylmuramoyl-L-alanyl-D-glutamate--2,6-diaminopimelate ligase [Actinocrinis sp.]